MKEISELVFPDDRKYSEEHEWALLEDDLVVVGISDFAQDRLGSVTFVEMPGVGATFNQGEECGTLESTKAVSEIFIPVGGAIAVINEALEQSPGLVNDDPVLGRMDSESKAREHWRIGQTDGSRPIRGDVEGNGIDEIPPPY